MEKPYGTLKEIIIREYPRLHELGYSPDEIAAQCGASYQYVYTLLDEVAARNNVTRESLLLQPHTKERSDKGVKKGGNSMSPLKKLDARQLRELIKRGFTLADFCLKYHCDETDLRGRLKRILHNNDRRVAEAMNEIYANGKKAKKVTPPNENEPEANPEEGAETGLDAKAETKSDTEAKTGLNVKAETGLEAKTETGLSVKTETGLDTKTKTNPEPDAKTDAETKIKQLRGHLDQLFDEVKKLDFAYTAHKYEIFQLDDAILSLREKIAELERQIDAHRSEIDRISAERQDHQAVMNRIGDKRDDLESEIEKTDAEIRRLTAVRMIVHSDGDIEVLNGGSFVPSTEGADQLAERLFQIPRYEDLSVKQLRLLAKILQIQLNATGYVLRISFKAESLNEIYKSAWEAQDFAL